MSQRNRAATSLNTGFVAHCVRPNALHFAKPEALGVFLFI